MDNTKRPNQGQQGQNKPGQSFGHDKQGQNRPGQGFGTDKQGQNKQGQGLGHNKQGQFGQNNPKHGQAQNQTHNPSKGPQR